MSTDANSKNSAHTTGLVERVRNESQTERHNISARLLMLEALQRGYEVLFYPGSPSENSGIVHCVKDGKEFFFQSTYSPLTPSFGFFAANDKVLTNSLLASSGVHMPATMTLATKDSAEVASEFLARHKTVVAKPSQMNHGDGVTVGIDSIKKLEKAIDYARTASSTTQDVIVQEQVEGKEFRFLVLDGKVIAVAHRTPPFVTGDGKSTVADLVAHKNTDPRRGEGHLSEMTRISLDDVLLHKGQAFLESIPNSGDEVRVLDTSNLSRGGESIDCTEIASPALKQMAVSAARGCFLSVAGVDIITDDITNSSVKSSYVIEVNLAPGLRMHQFPSIGERRDVAAQIFTSFEKTARPVGKELGRIGRSEVVKLPALASGKFPARIDTGATLSSIWASDIREIDGGLTFRLFGEESEFYTGELITVKEYDKHTVSSSMGQTQVRYKIMTTVALKDKKIRASVTLADRSTQVYPILIGRNVIRNKFIVDVSKGGGTYASKEREKRVELDALKELGNL